MSSKRKPGENEADPWKQRSRGEGWSGQTERAQKTGREDGGEQGKRGGERQAGGGKRRGAKEKATLSAPSIAFPGTPSPDQLPSPLMSTSPAPSFPGSPGIGETGLRDRASARIGGGSHPGALFQPQFGARGDSRKRPPREFPTRGRSPSCRPLASPSGERGRRAGPVGPGAMPLPFPGNPWDPSGACALEGFPSFPRVWPGKRPVIGSGSGCRETPGSSEPDQARRKPMRSDGAARPSPARHPRPRL